MKKIYRWQQLLSKLIGMLFLFPIGLDIAAQQSAVWEKFEVKERTPDLKYEKKRNATYTYSSKAEDMGMTFEMSSVWSNDKKRHTYRGHVAWKWSNAKGPVTLIPGEAITIEGIVSNLSGEPNTCVSVYVTLGSWGFMKPRSGKSGDECAKPNGSANMIGTFTVPKEPAIKRDGSRNLFITLTFSLSGGNNSRFIERSITYKWTPVEKAVEPVIKPPVIAPPEESQTTPQAFTEKMVYKAGEKIVVKFKNLPGFTTDWIGIYGAKAYHANEYIEWKYTNGLKEGSMQFDSPRYGPGDYMFRIYENNGYKLLVQTVAFKVVP